MTDYSIRRYSEYTDGELLGRLREYAEATGKQYVSARSFCEASGIAEATISRHFGTWKTFCERAGLSPRYERSVDKVRLFENLDRVWGKLGRQPRFKELKQPLSPISISRYKKVFNKSWYEICVEFLSWKSGAPAEEIEREARARPAIQAAEKVHETRREVPLGLRYEVLKRCNFRCVKCGRSPATDLGVQLHVDHVRPWAGGGESVPENLQALCSDCNLGKSDRHDI